MRMYLTIIVPCVISGRTDDWVLHGSGLGLLTGRLNLTTNLFVKASLGASFEKFQFRVVP